MYRAFDGREGNPFTLTLPSHFGSHSLTSINDVEIGDGSDDPLFTAFDLSYRLLHKERQLLVKSDEYLHHIHITA